MSVFSLLIPALGVSVITQDRKQDQRKELLYAQVKDVKLMILELPEKRKLHAKVQALQIDNQFNHNT